MSPFAADGRRLFEVRSVSTSSDVTQSVQQMVRPFAAALDDAVAGVRWPLACRLWVGVSVSHPSIGLARRSGGTFDKTTETHMLTTDIDYAGWASPRWDARTRAWADGVLDAVARLPKTRADSDARHVLCGLIGKAQAQVTASPPDVLAPIGSSYLVLDAATGSRRFTWSTNTLSAVDAGYAEIVSPIEAARLAPILAEEDRAGRIDAVKLYRTVEGVRHYREAWFHEGAIVEHSGICGETGETVRFSLVDENGARSALIAFADRARIDGFKPVPISKYARLIVEYAADRPGDLADLQFRDRLEALLNNRLGWLGLGSCDGGSAGSGTMEACCFVVDFRLAKAALERDLAGTEFGAFSRIYRER